MRMRLENPFVRYFQSWWCRRTRCLLLKVGSLDKAKKHYDKTNRFDVAATQAFDTVVWQTFASVFVPGFTINRVVKACNERIKELRKGLPPPLVRWLPTAVGIGIIPLIIHPIDDLVHVVMDNSIRTLYR